jgi:RNA polymerase primary sigma factor
MTHPELFKRSSNGLPPPDVLLVMREKLAIFPHHQQNIRKKERLHCFSYARKIRDAHTDREAILTRSASTMVAQRKRTLPSPPGGEKPLLASPPPTRRSGLKQVPSKSGTSTLFDSSVRPYLNEIGTVSLLSVEEEIWLAQRIERGQVELRKPAANQKSQLVEDGKVARHRLIEANLRLVVSIARRYCGFGMALEDLIGEGNIGLIRTVETFDATRGYRFGTYATWWIRQAITRAISEKARLIRLPAHAGEQIQMLIQTRHTLFEQLRREPSEQEMAAVMGIPPKRVRALVAINYEIVSLEKPFDEEHRDSLADILEIQETSILDLALDQQALREQVESLLARLGPRKQRVMRMRFGLLDDSHAYSLNEVSKEFQVTRERIRQIEVAALAELRCFVQTAGADLYEAFRAIVSNSG